MYQFAIIGGGPAGLYSAYRLASAGLDVILFEEHDTAGDPVHCTGVLAAEAFDEFDIPREAILNTVRTARFFGPSGGPIEFTTSAVEAIVVDRLAFDRRLADQARAAGAHLQAGVRVLDVTVGSRSVTVTCAGGRTYAVQACILACGANYGIQRRLGMGMPSAYLQSAQLETPAARPGDVEVHFGSDIAPQGFAWAVPVLREDGYCARVGLMCERDPREHFERFLSRVAPRWQTSAPVNGRLPRTKLLPLGPIARTYMDRVLAVGDAAGLVKATTGGGIYYSLVSANVAAETLIDAAEHGDYSERRLAEYEDAWRALLGDELAAQMTLRTIANRLSDDEIDELFELARTDGIMPIVRRTAAFNRHRTLILSLLGHPPARRVLMRRMLGWRQPA